MKRNMDYHIHTLYLKCGDETLTIENIYARCKELGITSIAITDHLNKREYLPEHFKIKRDMEATPTDLEVFFSVELNVLDRDCTWPYDEEVKMEAGFQFAIGGVHGTWIDEYDIDRLVRVQHDMLCKCAASPLIDVVVHPWWFGKGEFERKGFPWFDDMSVVPEKLSREFARVAKEHGTAIEINANAIFLCPSYSDRFKEQYKDYIRVLMDEGPMFSICSDAHNINQLGSTRVVEDILEEIGVPDEQIWTPHVGKTALRNGEVKE